MTPYASSSLLKNGSRFTCPIAGLAAIDADRLREQALHRHDAGILPVRDVVEARARAERRRRPVDRAVHVRLEQLRLACRRPCRARAATCPSRRSRPNQLCFDVRLAEQELARDAIQHVHDPVAVRPEHHLARRAAPVDVGEHGHLRRVVVELVVRRELVIPLQLAGIGVERDDAVAVQVVAEPHAAVPIRRGVAGAPEREIRLGIVGGRVPDRGAALAPRVAGPRVVAGLAWRRDRVEAPSLLARLRVERGDVAADPHVAAGRADDHFVLDDVRRHRDRVELRFASATTVSHNSLPLFASIASKCASIVPMNNVSPRSRGRG